MRKAMLIAVLVAATRPTLASGPGLTIPWPIDSYGGTGTERAAFHDGHVGVLMGRSPWSQLFEAWRLLHYLPVGAEAGVALDEPCCDGARTAASDDCRASAIAAASVGAARTPCTAARAAR